MSLPARLAVIVARQAPAPLKRAVHDNRFLERTASALYGGLLGRSAIEIKDGPLRGMKLAAGKHTSHAHISGTYERPVQEAVDKLVPAGSVCYDLGASIGYMTLIMARKAQRVYAFEPAPNAILEIARHTSANGMTNVTIVPSPVSGNCRLVPFCVTDAAYGSAINEHESRWPILQLETITIDDFAARHPPPDFMKIDVEGEEGAVLEGARSTLAGRRTTICCEIHSLQAARSVVGILADLGYRVTLLDDSPYREPKDIVAGEFHVIGRPA